MRRIGTVSTIAVLAAMLVSVNGRSPTRSFSLGATTIVLAAILVISMSAFVMPVNAQKISPVAGDMASLSESVASVAAGNTIYEITVEDTIGGTGIGTYTVRTGPAFPQPIQNVLFDGATQNPWSTYLTVRSYTSGTDYVSTSSSFVTTPLTLVNLDTCAPSIATTATSATTTWNTTRDPLLIEQVTAVEGTTVADSRVRVTTNVTNLGVSPVDIGIRYEWDLMIDGSDDSWFVEKNPDNLWTETEIEYTPPAFERFETTNDPASPVFSILGTVTGPPTFTPPPTPPDRFVYASWGSSYNVAFDYTPTGITGMDSAVLYYWGNNVTNAIELVPGETVSVTQYLYAIPPLPDPYIYSQWDSSTWHLTPGGDPVWNNPCIQLYDTSTDTRVSSGNLQIGTNYTVNATIYNSATVSADGTQVTFTWARLGIGQPPTSWTLIGSDTVDVPPYPETVQANVYWTPTTTGHCCIVAEIHHPSDSNTNNNKGQENTQLCPITSSKEISFDVSNPTNTTALVYLEVTQSGGLEMWETRIEPPYPQVLNPNETNITTLMVNVPDWASIGENRTITVTGTIDGEIIGGIDFQVVKVHKPTEVPAITPLSFLLVLLSLLGLSMIVLRKSI